MSFKEKRQRRELNDDLYTIDEVCSILENFVDTEEDTETLKTLQYRAVKFLRENFQDIY